jgi:Flp pilus assembly protein TadB
VRVLLLIGIICVALALYGADRLVKARARARRRRSMSERLEAATVRVEEQIEQRQAAEQAGQALTSFMPAIQRPPSDLPGVPPRHPGRPRPARERPAARDHEPARRWPRSGEHKPRAAERIPHGEPAARPASPPPAAAPQADGPYGRAS